MKTFAFLFSQISLTIGGIKIYGIFKLFWRGL